MSKFVSKTKCQIKLDEEIKKFSNSLRNGVYKNKKYNRIYHKQTYVLPDNVLKEIKEMDENFKYNLNKD